MEQTAPAKKTLNRQFAGFRVLETDKPLLAKLQPSYRQILETPGSYADIARALGITKMGTVRSRLNRARAALVALRV